MKQFVICAAAMTVVAAIECSAIAQLPANVEPILNKAAGAVRQNRIGFDKDNAKPLADAKKSLADLVDSLNKTGQVKQATAVQNLMNNLEAEVFKRAKAMPWVPLPQNSIMPKLVGSWTHVNSHLIYNFLPDGSFSENHKANGSSNSTGRCVEAMPGVVRIDLSNNHKLEIRMAGDDRIALLVWMPDGNPGGDGIVLDRLR